ncbi:MarR family winged helix-turn-helix transcriptional regulator [Flexibacterium corallicola]|uniref:MarR family winged helix-turn-helix transcriptional regulator n=1 Tax=Flexibacterium corallicola TaxID=3037259 RepID=UPI00286F454A|nr:MarR family transcriptional regulator [Pseudovibrio sp. M1P-2-3]
MVETMAPQPELDMFSQFSLFEDDPAFDLENFIPLKIAQMGRLIESQMSAHLQEKHDLTIPDWLVLNTLTRSEGVSVRDLCANLELDTVAVSRAAKRLSQMGMIDKATNPKDRRLVVLVTTSQGRTLNHQVEHSLGQFESKLSSSWSQLEWVKLDQLLARSKMFSAKRS